MTARLGVLAANGGFYYSSPDINEVRQFLRDAGLDLTREVHRGWHSHRYNGAIFFDQGKYWGTYWPVPNPWRD